MQNTTWQAFYDINYGGSPGGVFTAACPPEALHSIENGLVFHCLKKLFQEQMKNKLKSNFNKIVQKWLKYPKQRFTKSYMADFPRLLFKDGLITTSDISAGTKMGILFAFVLTVQTKDGHILLHKNENIARIYLNII